MNVHHSAARHTATPIDNSIPLLDDGFDLDEIEVLDHAEALMHSGHYAHGFEETEAEEIKIT